jgi:hypothetical protein
MAWTETTRLKCARRDLRCGSRAEVRAAIRTEEFTEAEVAAIASTAPEIFE